MRLVAAAVAVTGLLAACGTPAPWATPAPSLAPSPTSAPAADLRVAGSVPEHCGSIGGCAYFVSIEGPAGAWKAQFGLGGKAQFGRVGYVHELGGPVDLPSVIPAGTYTLTLWSVLVSDVGVVNGAREFGPTDATCSNRLDVRGDHPIRVQGTFDQSSCEIVVAG